MVFGVIISFVKYICCLAAEVLVSVKVVCYANRSNVSPHIGLLTYCCVLCVFTVQKCSNPEELSTCLNVNLQTRRGK